MGDLKFDMVSFIVSMFSVFVSICAIYLTVKSTTVLNKIKEEVEVFFKKEKMLRGYDYPKELFKRSVNKPEDTKFLDISAYQLNIKQIFSDESKYQIQVYDCDWSDKQQCSKYEEHEIEIIKEKNRKTMPKIYYPNKSQRGQYGFVVKIKSPGGLLKINSYYFIFFRLGFVKNQNTNSRLPQGCWLITKTIDYKNKRHPFIFKPEPNQSFNLTADNFMKKRNDYRYTLKENLINSKIRGNV